jgi:hypothetical protein
MTVHLCFPRKLGNWSVVVLVALDVEACELEGETIENVDNATFDIAFRGQAVVGIGPRPVHGAVAPFDKTQVVAAEERRDAVGEEDVKEPKVWFLNRAESMPHNLAPKEPGSRPKAEPMQVERISRSTAISRLDGG